uniref:FAM212 domain-containing protein n=1 Tax=Geospiza parvula TaxID=87175 RepID=A0A8C3MTQ0_GEOPR
MEQHLRRLRQELLSMKEVGDGLHEQMNCMMGALQELKLLQVQTALEHLELSEQRRCCRSSTGAGQEPRPGDTQGHCPPPLACPVPQPASLCQPAASPESHQPRESPCSSQSLCREGVCPPKGPCWVPRALEPSQGTAGAWPPCQECPGCDDGHDWTSSLMSQSRNRQPLVLGDNIFADLVGNWLDLPEAGQEGREGRGLPVREQVPGALQEVLPHSQHLQEVPAERAAGPRQAAQGEALLAPS